MELLPFAGHREALLPGIVDLMQAHEQAVLGHASTSATEAVAEVRAPDVSQEHSVAAVLEGRVVGLRMVVVERPGRDIVLDCWAAPDLPKSEQRALLGEMCRGATDLAERLAIRVEPDRAAAVGDPWRASEDTWQLAAGAYRQDVLWAAMLTELGLRVVRTFRRMSLTHGLDVPTPAPLPAIEVRDAADEADLAVAHRLQEEAFADHWGGEPRRPFAQWLERQRSQAGFDPNLWSVAYRKGQPVGLCVGSDARAEHGVGHVPLLGVVRAARGQGIAGYLLRREFARSAARGYPETQLTVDSESLTGADRLYRSVGMTSTVIIDAWLRPI